MQGYNIIGLLWQSVTDVMPSRGTKRDERLRCETERLLNENKAEIREMDVSETEARRNIRDFLEHLDQFKDLDEVSDVNPPDA